MIKKFTQQEITAAEELMAAFFKLIDYENCEDGSEIFKTKEYRENAKFLPSQFTFCFPEEVYENIPQNVTAGIDTPMTFESGSFCFNLVYKQNKEDPECNEFFILTKILPSWIDVVDEYNIGLSPRAPKLTVREFSNLLISVGFEYEPTAFGAPCLFSKELTSYYQSLEDQQAIAKSVHPASNNYNNKL